MHTRPSSFYRKALLLIFSSLFAQVLQSSDDFTIEHSDCLIRIEKKNESLNQLFKEELLKKNFVVKPFIEGKRVLSGELYGQFTVTKGPEKLYKKCSVEVSLKRADGNRPVSSDRLIFKKTNYRSLPRVTFSGSERCSKAMKEAFIHMPKCVSIGFAGERK